MYPWARTMMDPSPSPSARGSRRLLSGRRHAVRWAVGLTATLAITGTSLLGIKVLGAGSPRPSTAQGRGPGTPQEFRYLAARSSNYCSLRPEAIASYARSGRLQGSCCNPMDLATYQAQVRELQRYRGTSRTNSSATTGASTSRPRASPSTTTPCR